MTFSIYSILIFALIAMFAMGNAKFTRKFDNSNPRDPEFWRAGFAARAKGAHQNSLEIFPFYAVSVIIANWQGAAVDLVNILAGVFLALRLAFIYCYWTDKASLRSAIWGLSYICVIAIFTSPSWSS
ncbi:MAPEG family protein [Polycladidibacter stylochi]|uniref:MAPEG family protein n=1 Tax=Polycladidibacter stylochi TaxID=1807766 RepID=UPI0008357DC8|nr:MAPEG family protein [Pseudovibrio stylochi]